MPALKDGVKQAAGRGKRVQEQAGRRARRFTGILQHQHRSIHIQDGRVKEPHEGPSYRQACHQSVGIHITSHGIVLVMELGGVLHG